MELLISVELHRAILLDQYVTTHLDDQIRPNPEYIFVINDALSIYPFTGGLISTVLTDGAPYLPPHQLADRRPS